MEVLCGLVRWLNGWHNWRLGGQLGERGEYWMGRRMSGLIWNSKLQDGSPHLCRLRTDHLAPVDKFELCTSVYKILWGPANLLASTVAELDDILPYLTGDTRDSAWAVHGVSTKAYTWKTCTRVRWAWLDYLIVVVNCCHSWCLRGLRVSCCQVITLVRLTLPWVFVIHSDMCNTCPLQSFRRIINFIIKWW
jgi:hypothetical protein